MKRSPLHLINSLHTLYRSLFASKSDGHVSNEKTIIVYETAEQRDARREDDALIGIARSIRIEVAEFLKIGVAYVEGTRMLAQTIVYDETGRQTESMSYYADGSLHIKEITSYDLAGKCVKGYRYDQSGSPRDSWMINYNLKEEKVDGYRYNDEGILLQKYIYAISDELGEQNEKELGQPLQLQEVKTQEFDSRGNWVKEIMWVRRFKDDEFIDEPLTATYRTIKYY